MACCLRKLFPSSLFPRNTDQSFLSAGVGSRRNSPARCMFLEFDLLAGMVLIIVPAPTAFGTSPKCNMKIFVRPEFNCHIWGRQEEALTLSPRLPSLHNSHQPLELHHLFLYNLTKETAIFWAIKSALLIYS